MRVAVAGMWHLGTVTAACVAGAGHEVVGIDADPAVVAALAEGRPPLFEPGLAELVAENLAAGRLRFAAEPAAAAGAEILWVAHDTPVDEEDRADVEAVVAAVERFFPHLAPGALVLISSQLPVGSTARLEAAYRQAFPEREVGFAYAPENLRLGKAIEVFTRADRYVVGVRSERDRERLAGLLASFTQRIEWMSVESAEMVKHALNAFLAVSVVFANELAAICEQVGADAREVERGLKSESRIGPRAYLRPGAAYAGGTLARDIMFLQALARRHGLPDHLFRSVREANDAHKDWARRRLSQLLGDLAGRTVAVLGLTYKPGTDTLRRSSAVETCRWLAGQGARVQAFDPAVRALPADLAGAVVLADSLPAALAGCQAVLVATEWPEFRHLGADELAAAAPGRPLILDPSGFLEGTLGRDARFTYLSVGKAL